MRYPEGPAHGFLVLSDDAGTPLGHGELVQWLEDRIVASRLVIRFDDNSLYDEIVRFSQRPFFRVESYHLVERGPSFTATSDVEFDRSGRYRVRYRPKPDDPEANESGHVDVPDDVSNGMTSTLLKNVSPGASATTHLLVFTPKPRTLELRLTPEGTDRYWVGPAPDTATRFLIQPKVVGMTGAFATVTGKQPSELRMWIAQGKAPTLVRFEGPLYNDGPRWRIDLATPRWESPEASRR